MALGLINDTPGPKNPGVSKLEYFIEHDVYADLIKEKTLTVEELRKDWINLVETNKALAGNKIQYHFMSDAFLRTSTDMCPSFYEIANGDGKWLAHMLKHSERNTGNTNTVPSQFFELWRSWGGPVLFKASDMKRILNTVCASSVFDPCAGWGGRALGAAALGIPYHGVDTNQRLIRGYRQMTSVSEDFMMGYHHFDVEHADCLAIDWPNDDWIVTCPPYDNAESYEGEPDCNDFYEDFMHPFLDKSMGRKMVLVVHPNMVDRILTYRGDADMIVPLMKNNNQFGVVKELAMIWSK